MIDFIRMFSTDLDEHMNRKINYTSLWCENEILPLIAAKTRQELLPKQGDFYALMADETCDISTIEQMSICFRFVDDDLIIHENFLGFYDLKIIPSLYRSVPRSSIIRPPFRPTSFRPTIVPSDYSSVQLSFRPSSH
jgi:hypothetical protein